MSCRSCTDIIERMKLKKLWTIQMIQTNQRTVPQEKSTPDRDLVQMTYLQKTTGIIMKYLCKQKIKQSRSRNPILQKAKLLSKGAWGNKMINKFSPTRISKAKCLLLVGCLLFLYILDNSSILPVIDFEYIDYIKLLLWIGLALLIVRIPRIRFSGKLKHKNSIAGWAVIFGLINIMVMILAGFFLDLKSP